MTSYAQIPTPTPVGVETLLLDLFAPPGADRQRGGDDHARDLAMLWRVDAVHRAKNLAQLSLSLAHVVADPANRWNVAASAAPARSLARTYELLGRDGDHPAPVPCFALVSEIAVRLAQMFGRARGIAVEVVGEEVFAPPEHRRALALMCSELVINALKYAFPAGGPGTITVSLEHRDDGIALMVADDGVGVPNSHGLGQGFGLLDRLAHVLDATVVRSTNVNGAGWCVTVGVPAIVIAEEAWVD
ncbi:ATP-binding protein [Sphingomonas oligophenolica]|uniref:histidine kinase n=1 Tax=Sphingomonas oligophenolica TaxID=301154 RepID=A0A502CHY4_9SPHN|nr:sensor histidine kinase [Sphingomonas oligophenolica]TPG12423.1 sensor histidine kinase [Sphingomonas oligophenolica]